MGMVSLWPPLVVSRPCEREIAVEHGAQRASNVLDGTRCRALLLHLASPRLDDLGRHALQRRCADGMTENVRLQRLRSRATLAGLHHVVSHHSFEHPDMREVARDRVLTPSELHGEEDGRAHALTGNEDLRQRRAELQRRHSVARSG
jgi:hypothetical protein